MELRQVGEKTYYIKNATNIGVYKVDDNKVYLIDSGNDKDAGKKILKIMAAEGWEVAGIISTHSNADHIGGNRLISERTGCPVFAAGIEKAFTEFPVLEPSFLYGGYPFKDLNNKFLKAEQAGVKNIENATLPAGLEYFRLPGHFFDMIGVKTDDDVYFLADSLFSRETIEKYHLFFIYDVAGYLETLEFLSTLSGKLFIPSHCEEAEDISELIALNRAKVEEIADKIFALCENTTFEDILKELFDSYSLTLNTNQYVLGGSTVRSYLSYLYNNGKITFEFKENKMIWKKAL